MIVNKEPEYTHYKITLTKRKADTNHQNSYQRYLTDQHIWVVSVIAGKAKGKQACSSHSQKMRKCTKSLRTERMFL